MRIGFFMGTLREEIGGGFTFLDGLLSALGRLETAHEIFVFHYGAAHPAGIPKRVTCRSLSKGRPLRWILRKGVALAQGQDTSMLQIAAEEFRIDLLWFVSTEFVPVDTPYICTVLDLEYRAHPFFPEVGSRERWQAAEDRHRQMLGRAAYLVSGTATGKNQIVDFFRAEPSRVRVIPFPVSPFALEKGPEAAPSAPGKRPYLFYPAQFWPHKNHVALLRALRLLRDRHGMELDLVFCGSDRGNLSHVKKICHELGLDSQVCFLGFVSRDELHRLYRDAFALAYPSFFGPDNLPPLEAFVLGCPVLAARVTGAEDQLGADVLYFDPLNEKDLARAVLQLKESPGLRELLIERGKARALNWTADDYLRELMAIADEFAGYRRCWSSERNFELT